MPILRKRKQFPFFVLPAPKFLTRKLKHIDDFVVLVRVTPNITGSNYVDSSMYLILFSFYSFVMLLAWLIYALSKVPAALFTFLWHDGWMLFATLYIGYTIPSRLQIYEVLFWFTVALLLSSLWIVSQAKRFLREFRGLRKMHMMTEAERKDFSLQRFSRVSLLLWMSSSISYEPSADELLKLLREREQATEGQTQAIASTLDNGEQESEQEEQPSISMLLTLTHNVSLSLLAPGNKQVTTKLEGAFISLVGFLATRTRGEWTLKEELFKQVYHSRKENAFAMHRKRTNIKITKAARKAGFFPTKEIEDSQQPSDVYQPESHPLQITVEEEEDATTDDEDVALEEDTKEEEEDTTTDDEDISLEEDTKEEIDLFKNIIQDQVSSWQLRSDCNVAVFPDLTDFYQKVVEAQAFPLSDASETLSLEQLRQGCHRVMKEYGEGFLASNMKKGYIWPWALPLYNQYRKQCLFILAYANQREREYLDTCQTTSERYDAVEHIAQLYGWQAIVATSLELKDGGVSSEHDMERCLNYYNKIKKNSAAREVYQHYCQLRSRIDPTYEPGGTLKVRAEEMFPSKRKTPRSRKAEHDTF